MGLNKQEEDTKISYEVFKKQVLEDYEIVVTTRECSILGRREVFSGKGKFGIFGDGKEVPQIALNIFLRMVILDLVIIETRLYLWLKDF